MTEEAADPPTIKNAGRLTPDSMGGGLGAMFALAAMFAIIVGAMSLAIWASHRRLTRGLVIHAMAGVGAIILGVLSALITGGGWSLSETIIMTTVPLAVGWLVMGVIALVVGSVVRPAKRHDASVF